MTTILRTGITTILEPAAAARDAVRQAMSQVANQATFALVMCSREYEPQPLVDALNLELGGIPWAGANCEGVFTGEQRAGAGLLVAIVDSSAARVGIGVAGPVSDDPAGAGARAVSEALRKLPAPGPDVHRTLLLFPDASTGNAAAVVRGAGQEGGSAVSWAGGGAMGQLPGFAHGKAYRDHVVVVALDAPLPFGTGIHHGWRPYGPPTMVTRARGNVAVELDYERAFDVYRRTAESRGDCVTQDEFGQFAMTHPLGIPQADGAHVIRDPMEVDPDGSLRCIAEIPDGCLVRVMEGDTDALIDAARLAGESARQGVGGPLGGALVFDCVSRSLILRDVADRAMATLRHAIGEGVPIAGCLTAGEIGALGGSVPQFHNKTAVVLALASGDQ